MDHRPAGDRVRRLVGGTLTGDLAYLLTTDLCRSDLLVEIEGMTQAPVAALSTA